VWQYTGACDDTRLRALLTPRPFEDVVEHVAKEMNIACCHIRDCCDRAGYKRAIYCADVSEALFDTFFNSQYGYRGSYFDSPECGVVSNEVLFREVGPRLLKWTRTELPDLDCEFAARSLAGVSAKVWLAEESLTICQKCQGEWSSSTKAALQIVNGRWECDSHTHAQWGRQAHRLRKLRFIGAFLNDSDDEYVAPHKRARARDIWARGWA
jgi:hypothetical protein